MDISKKFKHLILFIILNSFTLLVGPLRAGVYVGNKIPATLDSVIKELVSDRKIELSAVSIDKNDHWVVVGKNGARYYSNLAYFDGLENFRPKLNQLLNDKAEIEAISFSPGGNWVIVTRNATYYSSINGYQKIGLFHQLEELKKKDHKTIQGIYHGPHNYWVIVADGRAYANPEAAKHPEVLKSEIGRVFSHIINQNEKIESMSLKVKSTGSLEYVVVSGHNAYIYPRNKEMHEDTATFFSLARRFDFIAHLSDGHVLTSATYQAVPKKYSMDISVPYNDDCDSNGENCKERKATIWKRMEANKVAGLSYAIINDNKVEAVRTFGYRHWNNHQHIFKNSKFSAASLSKFMAGLTMAVASQKINLTLEGAFWHDVRYYLDRHKDTHLGNWYDSLNSTEKSRLGGMAIGDLLSNTAGTNVHGIGLYSLDKMPTLSEILRGQKPWTGEKVKPVRSTRTKYDYSGGGFTLAQAILEKEAKLTYSAFANENVLNKMKLYHSTFYGLSDHQRENDLAYGHNSNLDYHSYKECPTDSAGGLYTTTEDYANFVLTMMNEGKIQPENKEEILPKELINQILSPRILKGGSADSCSKNKDCDTDAGESCWKTKCQKMSYYGYGVGVSQDRDSKDRPVQISHSGAQDGYNTYFLAYPGQGKGIVIFTNAHSNYEGGGGGTPLINEIVKRFKELYL